MKRIALVLLSSFILHPSSFGQGSLTPPGPPTPTMKTLDQVEPRTPITNLPYSITLPGSYYVVSNLTGATGITISAGDVTLDLMGFALVGGAGDGVTVSGIRTNIAIRNGTVRGWSGNGIGAGNTRNGLLVELRASGNGAAGLVLGEGGALVNCVARGNGIGIQTTDNCTIKACTASANATDGISVGSGNTIIECTSSSNSSNGVVAGNGNTIQSCTARTNGRDGIRVSTSNLVKDNTCDFNNRAGVYGNSILVLGSANRIDGNHCIAAAIGIGVAQTNNVVVRNTIGYHSLWDIDSGVRPIFIGPDITSYDLYNNYTITNTNPWANFIFQ
jgi:hypothetical protein